MRTQLNEVKKLQKIAGLLKEDDSLESKKEMTSEKTLELEENITIDEYNNVHANIEIAFSTIIKLINSDDPLTFVLCNNTMSIPIDKLFMKKEQLYKIKKSGLSKIKGSNIYDVDDKADIIVKIKLVN